MADQTGAAIGTNVPAPYGGAPVNFPFPIVGGGLPGVPTTTWDGLSGAGDVVTAFGAYQDVFIPTIWSSKFLVEFYDATVLAAISNTEWEGEIQNFGNTVIIRTKPKVEIFDYAVDQPLQVQRPLGNKTELVIDRGKYFNTVLDDVMEVQSDVGLMNMWAESASEEMKIRIDQDVLRGIAADVITEYTEEMGGVPGNTGNAGANAGRKDGTINLGVTTAPVLLEKKDTGGAAIEIIDYITYAGQVMDEANIPEQDRWFLIPAWMNSMIKRSELRDASLTGDGTSPMRNGRLGVIDRFTLYATNLLPQGVADGLAAGETQIFFGHKHGLTFASQMSKMESLRAESTFGSLMRGLQTFGFKVVDGTAIGTGVVAKA